MSTPLLFLVVLVMLVLISQKSHYLPFVSLRWNVSQRRMQTEIFCLLQNACIKGENGVIGTAQKKSLQRHFVGFPTKQAAFKSINVGSIIIIHTLPVMKSALFFKSRAFISRTVLCVHTTYQRWPNWSRETKGQADNRGVRKTWIEPCLEQSYRLVLMYSNGYMLFKRAEGFPSKFNQRWITLREVLSQSTKNRCKKLHCSTMTTYCGVLKIIGMKVVGFHVE